MQKYFLWNRDFLSIWFSNLFLFITFYTLVATLPMFVTDILKSDKQEIGLVLAVFLIAAVLFRPLAGQWLDRLGRKKILLVSLALFLASSVIYLWVKSLAILLILRFIHGISFGVSSTATGTIAADIIPEKHKGEGIGYYALSYNVAMFIGPFLGLTILSHYNFTVLFVVLSVISLLSFLCGNVTQVPKSIFNEERNNQKSFHWKLFIEPNAVPVSLTGFFLSFAFSGLFAFIPLYAKELGIDQMASYFYVVYALMMVLSRPLTGKLFDRFGEHIVIYPGMILYVVGLICLSQAQSTSLFLTAGAIIGLGFGSLSPSLQSIAVKSAPTHQRGLATGTYLTFFDTGVGLGSFILGVVVSSTNYHTMYLISSIIVIVSSVIYYALYHRKKMRNENYKKTQVNL